jgi:hypothetical protein
VSGLGPDQYDFNSVPGCLYKQFYAYGPVSVSRKADQAVSVHAVLHSRGPLLPGAYHVSLQFVSDAYTSSLQGKFTG